MKDFVEKFLLHNSESFESIHDFKNFLQDQDKTLLTVSEEDIRLYKDHLFEKYDIAQASERLLVVRDLYTDIRKRSSIAQHIRYGAIILFQALSIYFSSVWIVPKYMWPSFLWLDRLSEFLFGSRQVFFTPGLVGSVVGLAVVSVLIARGWLERPRNFLAWIVLVLNWWILAVMYGLIIGDESSFFSGSISSYLVIIAATALFFGFKQIIGYALLALIVLAGFNITSVTAKLGPMVFPYLVSLAIAIYAQNPEIFDSILGWVNAQFLSGKAFQVSKDVSSSITDATHEIAKAASKAAQLITSPDKTKFLK